jgi:hypothetical protein
MFDVTFYAVVSPKYPGNPWRGLAVPKVTQGKPTIPRGSIALKLKLSVPASLFNEFIPEGTITLPADASIGRPAIEVQVPKGLEITPDVRLQLVPYEDEVAP